MLFQLLVGGKNAPVASVVSLAFANAGYIVADGLLVSLWPGFSVILLLIERWWIDLEVLPCLRKCNMACYISFVLLRL